MVARFLPFILANYQIVFVILSRKNIVFLQSRMVSLQFRLSRCVFSRYECFSGLPRDAEGKSSHDSDPLRETRHRWTWTRARVRVFLFFIDATGDASTRQGKSREPRTREILWPPEGGSDINRRSLYSSFFISLGLQTCILPRTEALGSGRCVHVVVSVFQRKQSASRLTLDIFNSR